MIADRSMVLRSVVAGVLVLAGGLLGCARSSPPGHGNVTVTAMTLGRSLAPDETIAADSRTNLFWTTDTFYVSVTTEGSAPSATLKARWTYQDGTVVGESTKTISPTGPTTTAFQASNPERWNPGDYKVEVFVDDVSAGTKDLNAR
jgi:hypothetical protein